MNHTLTLTGSITALTAAMAAFEQACGAGTPTLKPVDVGNSQPVTPVVSTDTGLGTAAPMPPLSAPSGAAPIPAVPTPPMLPASTDSDDDASGGDTDGSGLDAEGLPWDARIHTSTKTKTAKGLWTKVRGGPKGAELAAIEAELRANIAAPVPQPPVASPAVPAMPMPTAPVPQMPVVPPMPVQTADVVPAALPVPMPVAAAEPVQQSVETDEQWDFAKLMQQIGDKIGTQITPETLASVCGSMGIASIMDLAPKPELIGDFVSRLKTAGVW